MLKIEVRMLMNEEMRFWREVVMLDIVVVVGAGKV